MGIEAAKDQVFYTYAEVVRLQNELDVLDGSHRDLARRLADEGRKNAALRASLSADALEPLVTKAIGAYTEAVFKDNYQGDQERFIAEYLAKALANEQPPLEVVPGVGPSAEAAAHWRRKQGR